MENRILCKLRITWSIRYRSIIATGLLLVMFVVSVVSPGTTTVLADAGDYSIDWIAANPYSYNHLTGGGAYDDRTIGLNADVVESLEGADFACGDIVTYLAYITIDNPSEMETIELTTRFSANTTGQPGAGHVDIVNVAVNYGVIEDLIPGENTVDDGIDDDWDPGIDGSTATLTSENFDPILADGGGSIIDNPGTNADLVGVITVDDLEASDTSIVVRIDVQVGCTIPSGPTGNLQARLSSARVIGGGTISGGEQTIPFKGLSQILFPGINLFKSVSLDGTCPGEETLTVPVGTTVHYCFRIHNNGETDLLNITLNDPMFDPIVEGGIVGLLGGFDNIDLGTVPDLALDEDPYADNYGSPLAYVADQDMLNTATVEADGLDPISASCSVYVYSADFGDLPADYYLTKLEDDGARHEIGDVYLGSLVDHETDGQEDATAEGDDYDDDYFPNEDNDEDGITLPAGYNWSNGDGEVLVEVSDYGCLTSWMDFIDDDGFGFNYFFTDTITVDSNTYNELIIENQLLSPGPSPSTVTFDLPANAADGGLFYGRFRLVPALWDGESYYCGEAPGLTGYWENGEVEDYLFIFGPNALTLTSFSASAQTSIPTIWLSILALLGISALAAGLLWRRQRSRPNH